MKLVHPSGVEKVIPQGFSWVTLLVGPIGPLCYGDLKWFAIMLAFHIMNNILMPDFVNILTGVAFNIIMAFQYNKLLLSDLRLKGFAAA